MSKPKSRKPKELAKVQKLAQMADELRQGEYFNITRLTTVKSFCKDEEAARQFVIHIAKRAHANMTQMEKPRMLDAERWASFLSLADDAMLLLDTYQGELTDEYRQALSAVKSNLAKAQNEYRDIGWNTVRMVYSYELLIIENSIGVLLSRYGVEKLAYQVARDYAEKDDPRYGAGLSMESAPMVQDIVDFWERWYMELWEGW
ncbi:MAG: hypothetical protein AAF639_19620 [Chloroflexota bacterium]